MNNFQDMGFVPALTQSLHKLGFNQPTPIQTKTIPLALAGKDVLGCAQTGTGKTLAFSLPLLNQLLTNPTGVGLILSPTRELAQQTLANIKQLLSSIPAIKTALLIGGDSYNKQMSQLHANPRIIIGTPGRIIDHLSRRSFKVKSVNFLILDETDRMFDMGFSEQIEKIITQLSPERQTLMFSATFPPKIERLAAKYMEKPERVFMEVPSADKAIPEKLTQEILEMREGDKYATLLTQLNKREGTILVFVKTKDNAEHLAVQLQKEGHNTCAIHGNLRQNKREQVMRAFRQGRNRIMIATDIVARGLDVPHIMHVINYDIPHAPEDYIHRIGRTARAGAKGFAVSFVSAPDRKRWKAIQFLIDPTQAKLESDQASKRKPTRSNSAASSFQRVERGRNSSQKSTPSSSFKPFKRGKAAANTSSRKRS